MLFATLILVLLVIGTVSASFATNSPILKGFVNVVSLNNLFQHNAQNAPNADFQIQASPKSLSIQPNSSGNVNILLKSVGFNGDIGLTATLLTSSYPANSTSPDLLPTTRFGQSTLTLSADRSATTILTITTSKNTLGGNYTIDVQAASQNISHSVLVFPSIPNLGVNNDDFTFSLSHEGRAINPYQGDSVGVLAGSMTKLAASEQTRNFDGSITLEVAISPSNNIVITGTGTFRLKPMAGNVQTLEFTTKTSTLSGTYDVIVKASGGGFSHSINAHLVVYHQAEAGDISLTSTIDHVSLCTNSARNIPVTLAGVRFEGPVHTTIEAPLGVKGLTVDILPEYSLAWNQSITMYAWLDAQADTPPGTYNIMVRSTAAYLSHYIILKFTVVPCQKGITVHMEKDHFTGKPGSLVSTTFTFNATGVRGWMNYTYTITPSMPHMVGEQFSGGALQGAGGTMPPTTFIIQIPADATLGTYIVTLKVKTGDVYGTVQATLTVTN